MKRKKEVEIVVASRRIGTPKTFVPSAKRRWGAGNTCGHTTFEPCRLPHFRSRSKREAEDEAETKMKVMNEPESEAEFEKKERASATTTAPPIPSTQSVHHRPFRLF